jgi:hypothetical protein
VPLYSKPLSLSGLSELIAAASSADTLSPNILQRYQLLFAISTSNTILLQLYYCPHLPFFPLSLCLPTHSCPPLRLKNCCSPWSTIWLISRSTWLMSSSGLTVWRKKPKLLPKLLLPLLLPTPKPKDANLESPRPSLCSLGGFLAPGPNPTTGIPAQFICSTTSSQAIQEKMIASLSIIDDKAGHVVGHAGSGLKQVHNILGAKVSLSPTVTANCCLITIWATNKRLVMLFHLSERDWLVGVSTLPRRKPRRIRLLPLATPSLPPLSLSLSRLFPLLLFL